MSKKKGIKCVWPNEIAIQDILDIIETDSSIYPSAERLAKLAISQHEEIERLKKEASEWKAFYFEAQDKLNNTREGLLNALRESGEPK